MTTRNRVVTPRKARIWTSWCVSLNVSFGGQGNGDLDTTPGLAFEVKTGRNLLRSDTLAHTWIKGLWSASAAGDSSQECLYLAVGFMPRLTDAADVPDLEAHDGDWQLHDGRSFLHPVTTQTPMIPIQLATIDIESAGQRTAPATGNAYQLFVYAQSKNTPSSGSFECRIAATQLWLTAN